MESISDYSKAYEKAKLNKDTAGMAAAHAAADKIRGYGTTTQVVNGKYQQVRTTPEVVQPPEAIKPREVQDNSQAAKKAYIESQLGQLKMNYNTNKANIDTAFNRNLSNADIQKNVVNDQFGDIKEGIGQSNFDALRYNKEMGANRGITSSAQMLGADVAAQKAGNAQLFAAEKDKNLAINGIQTFISQLGEAYGVDQQTLESNYGTAKLKAMSDGELMALESQLKVDMFNASNVNQFSLADKTYGQNVALNNANNAFTSSENQLNRDFTGSQAGLDRAFTAEQNKLSNDLQRSLASISAGNQSSMFKQQMAADVLQGYVSQVITGYQNSGSLTPSQMQSLNQAAYGAMNSGDVTNFNNLVSNFNKPKGYVGNGMGSGTTIIPWLKQPLT